MNGFGFPPKTAWHVCYLCTFVYGFVCVFVRLTRANFPPTDLWHIGCAIPEYFCVNFECNIYPWKCIRFLVIYSNFGPVVQVHFGELLGKMCASHYLHSHPETVNPISSNIVTNISTNHQSWLWLYHRYSNINGTKSVNILNRKNSCVFRFQFTKQWSFSFSSFIKSQKVRFHSARYGSICNRYVHWNSSKI